MAGGIRIEPYKPLDVRTPAVPGGGYIKVDASVGRFEPPRLLALGLDVAQGATAGVAAVAQQLVRDDEAMVKDADARLGETEQALLFAPQDGYLNRQGQEALTQAPDVLEAYGRAQQRELDAMANDEQRQMLEGLAQRRLTTFGEQVERHSAAERLRWHDAAGEQRIAQMQTDAGLYWSDDALLRRALGTTRAEVRDKAERHGWDSALTEATLQTQTSRTLASAIEAAVARNPERAQALRTRYAAAIEDQDRTALDALLSEAETRKAAEASSTEILNATPPDGEQPTPQWRLRQAEAIVNPDVRTATLRRLRTAIAADEAHVRTLGEQVLAHVLKAHLIDSSQIPVREWVALNAEHRQAIETRLDHNARGTEPDPNPSLVDALATQMTQTPPAFVRRDLVPFVARLPLLQWQRFRDWQIGLRRSDLVVEDARYALKRGLQLATKMLPADMPADDVTAYRAALVEEIDIWRRIYGKSPGDDDIAGMLERYVEPAVFVPPPRTLEGDVRQRPGVHLIQDANSAALPANAAAAAAARAAATAAAARVADAAARAAATIQAAPMAGAAGAAAMSQALVALNEAIRTFSEATDREAEHYPYIGNYQRILKENAAAAAARLGYVPTDTAPIDAHGEMVFVHPDTGDLIVRATDVRTPGVWERLDRHGNRVSFFSEFLTTPYPDPPLNPAFTWARPRSDAQILEANSLTPEEKAEWAAEQKAAQIAAQKKRDADALAKGGVEPPPEGETPPENDDDKNNDTEDKTTPPDASRPWRTAKKLTPDQADIRAKELGYERVNSYNFDSRRQPVYWNRTTKTYISPDADMHSIGTWKKFDRSGVRMGTYDNNLVRIKR